MNVEDLPAAAEYIGAISAEEQDKHRSVRASDEFLPEASSILGGQVRGDPPGIEHIYPEGNFVRASASTPFLQIGEVKYGKPILDRIITRATSLDAITGSRRTRPTSSIYATPGPTTSASRSTACRAHRPKSAAKPR